MYIPEFGRYYYITGVSSAYQGYISVSAHVDVLKTYAAQIRQCYAIVRRNEFKYNLMLDDGIFKAYQNPKHKIIKFPRSFNASSYVLALAGNSTNIGS